MVRRNQSKRWMTRPLPLQRSLDGKQPCDEANHLNHLPYSSWIGWLEKLGILKRRIIPEYPIRIGYNLTDLGRAFEPVLLSATAFSMKYLPKIVFKDGKSRVPSELNALSNAPGSYIRQ